MWTARFREKCFREMYRQFGFEAVMAVVVKSTGFGNVTPRSVVSLSTLWRNILRPSSETKSKSSKNERVLSILLSWLTLSMEAVCSTIHWDQMTKCHIAEDSTLLYKQYFGVSKHFYFLEFCRTIKVRFFSRENHCSVMILIHCTPQIVFISISVLWFSEQCTKWLDLFQYHHAAMLSSKQM